MPSLLPLLLKTKPKQDPSKPHGKKKKQKKNWQLDFIVIRAKKKKRLVWAEKHNKMQKT